MRVVGTAERKPAVEIWATVRPVEGTVEKEETMRLPRS